ncbi:MAG TPA: cell wall-binding repeat-containing protein, partial [Euzebya sp.]|nr:cell wall-binding repeat-containing protein [Euzebya sp.]
FALTVDYETSGSAVAGTDYEELPGSVTFGPGGLTATVDVRLLDPTVSRDLILTLIDGAGYVVGEPSSASVTLSPDTGGGGGGGGTPGGVPQVSVTADDDSFTFTRTGGATDELTAAYDVGGTAEPGEDYTELSGLVTFDAGSATATVDVDVLAGATEGATIEVTVVDGDVYDVGTPSSATITIDPDLPVGGEDEVTVLAGATRIQTAIAISQNAFPEDGSADAVVLARADVPFDALAATPLAPDKNGPLLLTDVADLHADTAAEIGRVMADGGTVYVLGGTAALSEGVETALTGAGFNVVRISGPTRYETALAVAEEVGEPEAILIASGEQFPDALSAGAAAAEAGGLVLLTPEHMPHEAVLAYVGARPDTPVYAIGGPAAGVFTDATPIVGSGREATSVMVAEEFFDAPTMVGLARGDEFADALTGGAHAALQGGPVVLTPSTLLHPEIETYLCGHSDALTTGFVYGGDAAIQAGVVADFSARLAGEGCTTL